MNKDAEERRREEFLDQAKEAEERAETPDSVIRQSWLRIADGYRDLARRH
jgi:hypothetical protein